jgi:hypothetical protein
MGISQERSRQRASVGETGDRKADFDLNGGGEDDGNHTISTFPGSGGDVVHGGPDDDGDNAELSQFVSLSKLSLMTRGITVSRMTRDQALALGEWDKARQYHMSKQLPAEMLNVGDRRPLDRMMQNAGGAPLICYQGRIPDRELIKIRRTWTLVARTDPSVLEVLGKLNGMVVSSEMVRRQVREDVTKPCGSSRSDGLRIEICDCRGRFAGRALGLM